MAPDRRPDAAAVAAALATPAAPAQRATPPSHRGPGTAHADEGSAKETIESILVAFILAFIFRAFIVEAFVIPTGSMAPTLLGAHMRFRCDDCAYRFDVNFTGRSVGDDVDIPSVAINRTYSVICPNCGLKVARDNPKDRDNDAAAPSVHYGDRILVLKYAYLLDGPRRWDVVVFKSPDADSQRGVPLYTINYIKRLVGRPNESVFILDGDVYVGALGARREEHVIQTKPTYAQERLWRIVFDNDYLPRRQDWRQPWTPVEGGGGWNLTEVDRPSRVFRFDSAQGDGGWLRFDPTAIPETQPLTDWLAYAVTKYQGNEPADYYTSRGIEGRNSVSDLKLSLFYERRSGDGPLRLQLSKLDDTFTAEILPRKVRLLRRNIHAEAAGEREILAADLGLDPTSTMHVEFTNVDYEVTLRINGRDYLKTTPKEYRPDIAFLYDAWRADETLPKPEVRIGAEAQACALSHVSLWRDVYYTNRAYSPEPPIQWGVPDDPIELGPQEFFVLGDNSLMSGDGRYWRTPLDLPAESLEAQPGAVPERFLLGKAFFVYWPAGHRPDPRLPGLVPNFAEMRFIH